MLKLRLPFHLPKLKPSNFVDLRNVLPNSSTRCGACLRETAPTHVDNAKVDCGSSQSCRYGAQHFSDDENFLISCTGLAVKFFGCRSAITHPRFFKLSLAASIYYYHYPQLFQRLLVEYNLCVL